MKTKNSVSSRHVIFIEYEKVGNAYINLKEKKQKIDFMVDTRYEVERITVEKIHRVNMKYKKIMYFLTVTEIWTCPAR